MTGTVIRPGQAPDHTSVSRPRRKRDAPVIAAGQLDGRGPGPRVVTVTAASPSHFFPGRFCHRSFAWLTIFCPRARSRACARAGPRARASNTHAKSGLFRSPAGRIGAIGRLDGSHTLPGYPHRESCQDHLRACDLGKRRAVAHYNTGRPQGIPSGERIASGRYVPWSLPKKRVRIT